MTFRPMLWPTLLALPVLAALIALGNWQMARLAWKEDLLARIEAGLAAPPRPLPPAAEWPALDAQTLRYTRVAASGSFDHASEVHVYQPALDGTPGYHIITPLHLEGGGVVLVDRGFVPPDRKEPATRPEGLIAGPVRVRGILVEPEARNPFTPDPDTAANIWHHRDPADIAAHLGVAPVFPLILEAEAGADPAVLPRGGQTRLGLRNPHRGYALTWYGLAAVLVAVWLALHVKAGRIAWR